MFRFLTKSSFLVGVVVGTILAVLLKFNSRSVKNEVEESRLFKTSRYKNWFTEQKISHRQLPFDTLRYSNVSYLTESKYLYDKIPILCVILVKSWKNAHAARDTWGKHCNNIQLLNITSEKKKIQIKRNNEQNSWIISCKMLKNVPDEYKWILVVYDYTFVLVENLRLFVAGLNADDKYYLGHAVKFWGTAYNMGQAGYILSRGTINIFKNKFRDSGSCAKTLTYRNQEDYYLGKNLAQFNITPVDTRDEKGLSTFHPYNLYHVFFPGENYYKFSIYPHKCCSPFSIAFQSIEGDKMYTYYYLLYTLQLFQFGDLGNRLPYKVKSDDEIWKQFLRDRQVSENITAEQYYTIWENIVDDPSSFAKHMKREEHFDYE